MSEIDLPLGGVSDELAFDRQKAGTCADAQNMQGWDEIERRPMLSRVAGQAKHTSAALIASTKVQAICDLVYDAPNVTYASLGSSVTVDNSASAPSFGSCANVKRDSQGRFYVLDGNNGVQVYTADLAKIAKIAFPTLEKGAVVRALTVDDAGRVIVGVSGGGDPKKAAIFCFNPIEDRKYKLLWQIPDADLADQEPEDVGWFTEELLAPVGSEELYALQNDTVNWKSRIAVYTDLGVPNPTRVKVITGLAYPANDFDRNPVDGAIGVAHEPNTTRGADPRSPETTGPLEDMQLQEILTSFGARAWSWHSSADVDGDGTNNANRLDGEVLDVWADKTGNGRHWFAGAVTNDIGPTLRKSAIAGRDSLFFNGTNATMKSAAGLSTEFQLRGLNKTTIPNYAKAQFGVIAVMRTPLNSTTRVAWGQAKSNAGSQDERAVGLNMSFNAGIIAAPGNVFLYEQPLTGSGQSGRVNGATGFTTILPGAFDADGLVIVTYLFDHGYDDIAGTPTRSLLRVNGRPVDRWTSRTAYESLERTILGAFVYPNGSLSGSRFQGDFLEFFCFSDWHQTAFGATAASAQQQLMAGPIYPDAVWGAGSDTMLERLEGFFAHRPGFAHKLPTSHYAALDALAVGNANDTITIDAHVYTLKAAPTTTADEVKIGASAFATLQNLMHAINGSGVPGTDYGSATVRHATVWSPGVVENGNTAGRPDLMVQRRDGRFANVTTFAVAESTSGARFAWITGANSITATTTFGTVVTGRNVAHYPHPFFLYKTPQSAGGPPRVAGVGIDSLYSGLISPYGIASIWDPGTGRLKAILTTGGPGQSGLGYGGVGYGIRFNSAGDMYLIGPRQAAVTELSVTADNVDVRKVVQTAAGLVVTNGATALTAWTSVPGAQTYHYPRMDVDKWDNVFVPIYQGSNGTSMAAYKKVATSSSNDAALLLTVTNLTNDPKGQCVAVDPNYPDLPSNFSDPRAERVLLGTELFSTSNSLVLYGIRLLSATPARTVTRVAKRLVACGQKLFSVTKGNAGTEISATAFSAASLFIDHCVIAKGSDDPNVVAVFVDGEHILIYDPKAGTLGNLRARYGGEIPKRPKLTARYKNRLFFARMADFPTRITGSVAGDIYGWDFEPRGEDPIPIAAYRSDLTTTGDHADNVTALCPIQDDVMLVGGERSLAAMVGDPLMGGQFDTIWTGSGIAFGKACVTPDKTAWAITNEAELVAIPFGGKPEVVSRKIAKRLADAIDFSKFLPVCAWDPYARCIRITLTPIGAGDDLRTDFLYFPDTGAFWPRTYGHKDVQPSAICVVDGQTTATRVVLLGSRDGYVREVDASAVDDDGTRIDAFVDIDNMQPQGAEREALFSRLTLVTARAQGTARYDVHMLDNPDDSPTVALDAGDLFPGYNTPSVRFSGQNPLIRIASASTHERFALIRASMEARPVGLARARA